MQSNNFFNKDFCQIFGANDFNDWYVMNYFCQSIDHHQNWIIFNFISVSTDWKIRDKVYRQIWLFEFENK